MICAQTCTINLFEFFTFYVVLDFHLHKTKKNKIKCKNNQNNAYKEMHDAQMHTNEASNAWRILERSKKLDQGPKRAKAQP